MAKVKLTTARVTAFGDGTPGPAQMVGDVIEVSDAEAGRLIAAQQADPVTGPGAGPVEAAVMSPPRESATLPRPKK